MIGKVIIVGYFIGIFFLSVFAHEGIHWLQYRDIKAKQICFFGKSFAYLDTPNTQICDCKEYREKAATPETEKPKAKRQKV